MPMIPFTLQASLRVAVGQETFSQLPGMIFGMFVMVCIERLNKHFQWETRAMAALQAFYPDGDDDDSDPPPTEDDADHTDEDEDDDGGDDPPPPGEGSDHTDDDDDDDDDDDGDGGDDGDDGDDPIVYTPHPEEDRADHTDEKQQPGDEDRRRPSDNLGVGIQPVVWPTREEFMGAKSKLEYRKDRVHFAVCGPAGSGKSSLINAFRGLRPNSPGAARSGVVEGTTTLDRYTDGRQEMPYQRFVWYDVPGAGTFDIPSWQYFNQQGLFIFDIIILMYDTRFTEIDADILENCRRFNIPAFIVRSKADQHIQNVMNEHDDLTFQEARGEYIKVTRENLESNLRNYNIYDANSRCYLVSNSSLYNLVNSSASTESDELYIDEEQLLVGLFETTIGRRYGESTLAAVRQRVADSIAATGETAPPAL